MTANYGETGMLKDHRQVNEGEDADPDDIEEMPKQRKPGEAGHGERVQPAQRDLASHEDEIGRAHV